MREHLPAVGAGDEEGASDLGDAVIPAQGRANLGGLSSWRLSASTPGLSGYCRRPRNSSRIAASENRPSDVSAVQYVHPLVDTPDAAPLAAEGVL